LLSPIHIFQFATPMITTLLRSKSFFLEWTRMTPGRRLNAEELNSSAN